MFRKSDPLVCVFVPDAFAEDGRRAQDRTGQFRVSVHGGPSGCTHTIVDMKLKATF